MSNAHLQKAASDLVGQLASLAEDAATTGEGARVFLGLVEAAKALPEDRARRLREFFQCFAHELRGLA